MIRWMAPLLFALASCDSCDAPPPPPSLGAGPTASVPAPVVTTTSSVGPWAEALSGDSLAARRLAELHDATALLAIARGGPQSDAALEALAHADDAELALAGLAELGASAVHGERALQTIVAIAGRPTRSGEPLAPDSLRACIAKLDELSRDDSAPRPRRVLAVNALRAFARAGYLKPARITADLD